MLTTHNQMDQITKLMLEKEQAKMINKMSKIYSTCIHESKFYIFKQVTYLPSNNEEV